MNSIFSGAKVEDAFLETARKIYQNIQDGRRKWLNGIKNVFWYDVQYAHLNLNYFLFAVDLNASESGVQHKPSQPGRTSLTNDTAANKDNCSC